MSPEELFFQHYRKIAAGTVGAFGLMFVMVMGCPSLGGKSNTESLEGTITSNGKPVRWGTVSVVGSDNKTYSAHIQPNGTYRLTGLPPGPVRVSVNSANPNQRIGTVSPRSPAAATPPEKMSRLKVSGGGGGPVPQGKQAFAKSAEAPQAAAPKVEVEWFPIPSKYANPGTSGLTTTAGPATGPFNIQVD